MGPGMDALCRLAAMCACTFAAAAALASGAQPPGPLRLVVPLPVGSAPDVTARALAGPLSRSLDRPVLVENRPGAAGSLGMVAVARAAPLGNVLGVATPSTHTVYPAVYSRPAYDPLRDFAPVTELANSPELLVVHPSLPAHDLGGLVAHLRARPGRIAYASTGNGTLGHLRAEFFKSTTGASLVHIPYPGVRPALADLFAGVVQVHLAELALLLPHVRAGRLRPLAVSWPQRLSQLPAVPTFAEAGFAECNEPLWVGLVAPAGTPQESLQQLHVALREALRTSALAEALAVHGVYPSGAGPERFASRLRREFKRTSAVAGQLGLRLD